MLRNVLKSLLINAIVIIPTYAMDTLETNTEFSAKLGEASGFGLPHTVEINLDYSKEMLLAKGWLEDHESQFGTLNNMGSNINDTCADNMYGQIYDFAVISFKENCGDFVLDIGCGTGHGTAYLLKQATVVFNDICTNHLALVYDLHRLSPGKGFYLNNKPFPHGVDFPSNCFTGINCSYVGHYLSPTDLEACFQKMSNSLKPGGIIFYRVLTINSHPFSFYANSYEDKSQNGEIWPGYIEDVSRIKPNGIKGLPNMVHPHGLKEVGDLAELSGLVILDHCVTGYHEKFTPLGTFMAILQKPLI